MDGEKLHGKNGTAAYAGIKSFAKEKREKQGREQGMCCMPYAAFVTQIYECIRKYASCDHFSLTVFSEGPQALKAGYTGNREYAVLRNQYARDYYGVMEAYQFLHAPNRNPCVLEKSRIYQDEVKVTHSCYAKNLYRWMHGTVSRKQKCRAEFCALVWCWYVWWLGAMNPDLDQELLGTELLAICHVYSSNGACFCMDALWDASISAYRKTLERK